MISAYYKLTVPVQLAEVVLSGKCYNLFNLNMAQILKSKNLATKFQILLEIAANQPNVRQKDIAPRLGVTSQAVSEYVKELIKDGWLSSQGRSRYIVTREGVDWILRMSRQLHDYSSFVNKVIADISTCPAIADADLSIGQQVSLHMKDGLLFVSDIIDDKEARGIAKSKASKGQDIAVSNIEGVIKLKTDKITICKVPNIQDGGSRGTNLVQLKKAIDKAKLVGAIGIESLAALTQIGIKPDYFYGVRGAAIEAAYHGLPFLIVCTKDEASLLVQKIEEENLDYRIVDLTKGKKSSNL